jgi:cell division transport system permease protein
MRPESPRPVRTSRREPVPQRRPGERHTGRGADPADPRAGKAGAARVRGTPGRLQERVHAFCLRHAQTLIGTLGRLARTPLDSMMTVTMIAVALALPLALHVLVINATAMTAQWNFRAELSVYLQPGLAPEVAEDLRVRLQQDPRLEQVRRIPAQEGLATLSGQIDLGQVLGTLDENPLPDVLVAVPAASAADAAAVATIAASLRTHPEVDLVREDLEWIRRLQAAVALLRTVTLIAGIALCAAVILVVGNAVRLEIAGRSEEIVVTKLIGATDGFVRRPFVYMGFWYGAAGGGLALLLIGLLQVLLSVPIRHLADAYDADFVLSGLTATQGAAALGAAALLGAVSAWIVAAFHLHRVEPN